MACLTRLDLDIDSVSVFRSGDSRLPSCRGPSWGAMMRRISSLLLVPTVTSLALQAFVPGSVVAATESRSSDGRDSVSADFNGDGFSDLAVGVVDQVGNADDAGAINVLYGSRRGLRAAGDQLLTQNTPGIADVAEPSDLFSWWLSSADFNGDGFSDLAAGAGLEDVGGVTDAGAVHVIYGSARGLGHAGDDFFTQDSPGVLDDAEEADCFGCTTGGGDLNRDGFDELLVGVQAEDFGGVEDAGAFHLIYGSHDGVTTSGAQLWTQDSAGIAGEAESGDNLGWLFATGDFGRSNHGDVAISAPFDSVGNVAQAGAVNVLYGSARGLRARGDHFRTQNSRGIVDSAEEGDFFGYSTLASDVAGTRHADLVVTAVSENVRDVADAGAVHVIRGSRNGITGTGDQFWTQDSRGIADQSEEGDAFGDGLAAANFGKGRYRDLAIGADGEDVRTITDAGGVHVIYGRAGGLHAAGDQFWTQDSPGVAEQAEANAAGDIEGDLFGYLLLGANFGRSPHADLAVMVPAESVGAVEEAGAANVLYGSPRGLTASGDQLWHQNSPGIEGVAEEFDVLGVFVGART